MNHMTRIGGTDGHAAAACGTTAGKVMRRGAGALLTAFLLLGSGAAFSQTISSISARQRYPWNNLIDIDYTIKGATNSAGEAYCQEDAEADALYIQFEMIDGMETNIVTSLTPKPPLTNGLHRVTWDPGGDNIRLLLSTGAVCRAVLRRGDPTLYMVIDLSGGVSATNYPVSYLPAAPAGGWTDLYKTNLLVLRKIDPGDFTMGSPASPRELGRGDNETPHSVTLTDEFYIGVFQVTQKQWELVKGDRPSGLRGDGRPVESVNYDMIRGAKSGSGWPGSAAVDSMSFLGRIRSKTGITGFDLATEAQWEYACRAGTTTALNNGKNLSDQDRCPEMDEVGRYASNWTDGAGGYSSSQGHTTVGSYSPNAWGLYDMHGNVREWCRDWYTNNLGEAATTNPEGPRSGSARVVRGGGWRHNALGCRSAARSGSNPDFGCGNYQDWGFRLSLTLASPR